MKAQAYHRRQSTSLYRARGATLYYLVAAY